MDGGDPIMLRGWIRLNVPRDTRTSRATVLEEFEAGSQPANKRTAPTGALAGFVSTFFQDQSITQGIKRGSAERAAG